MRFISVFFIHFLLLGFSSGQSFPTVGTVKDSDTHEKLSGANILIEGTTLGISSDSNGTFTIVNVPPGVHNLVVSLIGYLEYRIPITVGDKDSIHLEILLQPSHVETEEFVITGTRTVRNIADVPVRVESIPQEEVEEKLLMTPSNVAMLLNESTGMRVQTTSATSNTANLRIQGLNGRYTQLLTDGIPNFGGLSSGFGLTQLPPINVRQVEVVKGATSALYGADAIAGVVNFITKEPYEDRELNALINTTTQHGFDIAGFYSQKVDEIGSSILVSRNNQALFDVDNDGFADIAKYDRLTIVPKITYEFSQHLHARITVGYSIEERIGGIVDGVHQASVGIPYKESIKSARFDASGALTWNVSASQSFSLKIAGMRLKRDALYGQNPFNATQSMFYGDAQYSFDLKSQKILVGTAFNLDDFADCTVGISNDRSYRFNSPSVFAQDEIQLSNRLRLLLSGRVDFHNEFGTFFTPRSSLMFRPTSSLTFRLGGGTGFKAPTIFVEEAEEIGFRNVRPLQDVKVEEARSASFDVNYRTLLHDFAITVNTAFYLTHLKNALLVDDDSLASDILYLRNAAGATLTRGVELSTKLAYSDFKLSLGYTYLYATQSDMGQTYEVDLNPRHSFGAVLVWERYEDQFKVGIENYWTGSQRIARNPRRDRSPDYWITGVIAEKGFGIVRFFVNFENIFDARQTQFEPIITGDPFTSNFRTLPIYAPLEGRVVNGGIRVVL
ncbi:MAG: TonB-dependent receptor [Ignavibacteriae bacterium]|nr:TonB-dependent receptor [Ignavibacteriota bacterium]